MGFFGLVFWLVIIWLVIRYWNKREGRMMQSNGLGTGWYDSGEFYDGRKVSRRKTRQLLGEQQQYIESLEGRVSELEERLDFTERLLAERREPVSEVGR